MRITVNPDKEYANEVRAKLKANDGYCPCQLVKAQIQNVCVKSFLRWRKEHAIAVYISKSRRQMITHESGSEI